MYTYPRDEWSSFSIAEFCAVSLAVFSRKSSMMDTYLLTVTPKPMTDAWSSIPTSKLEEPTAEKSSCTPEMNLISLILSPQNEATSWRYSSINS